MKNQRGSILLIIMIIVVLAGIVAGVYLVQQKTSFFPKADAPKPNTYQPTSSTTIQNDNDLVKVSSDLNNTDLNSIDNSLNQNDLDTSTF